MGVIKKFWRRPAQHFAMLRGLNAGHDRLMRAAADFQIALDSAHHLEELDRERISALQAVIVDLICDVEQLTEELE